MGGTSGPIIGNTPTVFPQPRRCSWLCSWTSTWQGQQEGSVDLEGQWKCGAKEVPLATSSCQDPQPLQDQEKKVVQ